MTNEMVIHLMKIEKRYSGIVALRVPELELCAGDRAIIVGENGSGKSTLLRILAGLTRISSGTDHRSTKWRDMPIGYLPQEGGIYRDLSIRQNLAVFERLFGSPSDASQRTRIAALLGLSEMLDRRVNNLSGGFRRLAAIYCLLTSGAEVLFLDEPFASLDQAKQGAVEKALHDSATRFSLLVISEHLNNFRAGGQGALWSRTVQLRNSVNASNA